MEKLTARTTISDYMLRHAIVKKEIDNIIKNQLARSLSESLVKKDIDRIIMKREFNDPFPLPSQKSDETVYELECYVLTKDEHKEFEELRKFKHLLVNLIN